MKTVQLSQVPKGLYTVTRIGDMAIITMYDNVQEQTTEEDVCYSADQYQLKVVWRDEMKIAYVDWLDLAKRLENPQTTVDKRMARDMLLS